MSLVLTLNELGKIDWCDERGRGTEKRLSCQPRTGLCRMKQVPEQVLVAVGTDGGRWKTRGLPIEPTRPTARGLVLCKAYMHRYIY